MTETEVILKLEHIDDYVRDIKVIGGYVHQSAEILIEELIDQIDREGVSSE